MKFINRERELKFLEESYQLSRRKLFSLAIYGLRRVGKTRLIEKFIKKLGNQGIYFFITKNKSSFALLKEFESVLKENKVITELETFNDWDVFFETLLMRYKGVIAFDEFQNLNEIDKSIFGTLQKFIDKYEEKNLFFIFSGSTIGLIKKLFKDSKEPLYGRLKRKLFLKPLDISAVIDMCKELSITNVEQIIELYAIFGGFPKYYISIEDEKLEGKGFEKILESLFLDENVPLEEEVETILALEFGKRKGLYYDILTAIANGENTISKIASFLSKKESKLTRYVNELFYYFEIIGQEKQVVGNKKIFIIKNPIINFWFRFFYKDLSSYRIRKKFFIEKVKKSINSYIGKRFEYFCRDFLLFNPMFEFDEVGAQWGKFKGEKGKNTYEIDIVALNEKTKEILFGECKWKNKVNAEKVIKELIEKAGYVEWFNDSRKESFVIFAKSFSKKIDKFEDKKVYCFDLKDLEKALKK